MRDHQQGSGPTENATKHKAECLRVQCSEAFIEDDQISPLQKRARHMDAAPFPMRELPSAFADHLQHARRHAV